MFACYHDSFKPCLMQAKSSAISCAALPSGSYSCTARQPVRADSNAARGLAREIADNTSAVSVAMTRAMLWRVPSGDHPMAAHKVDSRAIYRLSKGADAKEGVQSFLEKRAPAFPLRVSSDMPDFYPWWGGEPPYE